MLSKIAKTINIQLPSKADSALAEKSSRKLSSYISLEKNLAILVKEGKKQAEV